jgi:hypothetical protein
MPTTDGMQRPGEERGAVDADVRDRALTTVVKAASLGPDAVVAPAVLGPALAELARRDELDTTLYAALVYVAIACCGALAIGAVISAAFAIFFGQPLLFAPLVTLVIGAITQLGRIRRLARD